MEAYFHPYRARYVSIRKRNAFYTALENSEKTLAKFRRPNSDLQSLLAKSTSNPASSQGMPKSRAESVIRSIVMSFEPPSRTVKRPSTIARTADPRCQVVGHHQYTRKPVASNGVNSGVDNDGDVTCLFAGKPSVSSKRNSGADDDDDVTYLYTVDSSSSGRIVQEIDLCPQPETGSFTRKKETIAIDTKRIASKGQKRKLTGNAGPRKRSNKEVVLECWICNSSSSLSGNGDNMFLASCGHMICKECSLAVSTTKCSCGKENQVLRKLYR